MTARKRYTLPASMLCLALAATGCKTAAPAIDDATLTRNAQSALSSDSSLSGQPVQVTVNNGVANLTGTVANDAQKTIAARDLSGISGIRVVNNSLSVGEAPQVSVSVPPPAVVPAPAAVTTVPVRPVAPAPAPIPARKVPTKTQAAPRYDSRYPNESQYPDQHQTAPIERQQQPVQAYTPPAPTFQTVNVPSGTSIPVRITQTLDSATTQEGDSFSGVVASDVVVDGLTVIPAGSPVAGHVDTVHEAGHFKGSSLLTVSLSGLTRRGDRMQISSDPYSVQGKGRGVNTAEKAGGGAAVGAILGGIFGGGKGAAIGAAAGGGVGAGSNAVTRGQQVQIASESVIRFHLATPITVRVRADQATTRSNDGLQPRNQ